MKFYKNNNNKKNNYKTYITQNLSEIIFRKDGMWHNEKDASYIGSITQFWDSDKGKLVENCHKLFYLNGKFYGNENDFNKKSWRRFVKLKAFLLKLNNIFISELLIYIFVIIFAISLLASSIQIINLF